MRSLSVIFAAVIISMFVIGANAQNHAAHHPDQRVTVQTDTGSGMGMMQGMMQGGMMSQQGMRAMCSKMMKGGMMDGKGMMHGKGMQGGMMGHMMNMMHGQGMMGHHSPMGTYMHLINHVPNMKTSLELSDDQINNLKSIQSNFFKRKANWDADIEKKEIDLDLLLDKKASTTDVRKTLKSIYDAKLDMKVASYEVAQKMKEILSAEQQEKLDTFGSMCLGKGMMGMQSEKM